MESRLFQIVEKTVNLIKLNIIWVLCSLPLVTAGAALCALHVTAVRILEGEEGYVFRDFWTVYRSKMRLSLKLWLPLLAAAITLIFDYMFWREVEGNLAEGMRVLICVLSGLWIALVIYVFPLAARMETAAGRTFRNGMLLVLVVILIPQSFQYSRRIDCCPNRKYILIKTDLRIMLRQTIFGIFNSCSQHIEGGRNQFRITGEVL